MSGHSAGPWRLHPTDDCTVIDKAGNEVACVCGDYNHPDTWPIMEANARLVVAAPDLLEALEALTKMAEEAELAAFWARSDKGKRERVEAMVGQSRAALARASGAAPHE